MASIFVLGAGRVGHAIALDLSARHEVTAVDRDERALDRLSGKSSVAVAHADVTDTATVRHLVGEADLVICAVPGFLGFESLRTVIESGKPVVDISFMPENALDLNDLAEERGVTALIDFGVAPGMDNFLLGYHDARMSVTSFECLVGGLPKERSRPFEYKAPFSPIDVIEEYTRPARLVQDGTIVTKPALSEVELVEFEGIGTLEAFNTDGLRSLLVTMPHIPNMREKTLRYPGHASLMQTLADAGFFSSEPRRIGESTVTPLNVTSALLVDSWQAAPDEEELTVMRVTISGEEDGRRVRHVYDLLDVRDDASGISSMARTTGYACAAAAEFLLAGRFDRPGVFPPELVGLEEGSFEFVMDFLGRRSVTYRHHSVEPS